MKRFSLPDLGEGLTESELVSWRVAVGDHVDLNQVIAEVETAKLEADVPEEIAGSLVEFVGAIRTGRVPSGEVHANVLSLAMVEAAVRSAETGERVSIADVLAQAHAQAIEAEPRDDVRAALVPTS